MAIYCFDLFDGRLQRDEKGQEIAGKSQLRFEVRRTLSELVLHGHGPLSAIVSVRDGDNQTVITASISLTFAEPETHH